ncbi:MAG: hypothetical protein A2W11_03735 [Ignavibacteria bacterium RBG_16_35_7]|nr:MAG: hypothetical protein A2W11_03735 [Ignavibacteria bacterium RBG_16_35_7]
MDYSNTPLRGGDLLKPDVLKEAEKFKVDFLRKNFSKLKLFENGQRHIEFVNNCNDRLCAGNVLTERQVFYLDSLFEQMLDSTED